MKVLFTPITSSSVAQIIRSFAVAEKLKERGDEVFFTSCTQKKTFIESNGYKVVESYKPFNLNDPDDQSINYLSTHKDEMTGWFKAEIDAAKKVKPDVMVISSGLFGPPAHYATDIPTIALLNVQYLSGSKGLVGLSMADDSLRSKGLREILRPIFKKEFTKNYLNEINDSYAQLGIRSDFVDNDDLYAGMNVLIPGDEEFEPQFEDKCVGKYIGPIFWDGFERDEEITDEFLEKFKGNKKMIFMNFGGSVFDKGSYDEIISEISKLDAQKVIALGLNFDRKLFEPDREDLIIRNFVPGLRVSKHSDVVVNTGSQGSIMQALSHGVPVVAIAVGMDQAFFANRLEEMKLGININKISLFGISKRESYTVKGNDIPSRIASSIDEILSNRSYKDNTESYAKRLLERSYGGVDDVIEYMDSLI